MGVMFDARLPQDSVKVTNLRDPGPAFVQSRHAMNILISAKPPQLYFIDRMPVILLPGLEFQARN